MADLRHKKLHLDENFVVYTKRAEGEKLFATLNLRANSTFVLGSK